MFTYCKDILTVRDVSMILPCFVFLRFNEVCELLVSYISFYSDYKILRMRHSKTDVYREDRNVKKFQNVYKSMSCTSVTTLYE